MFYNFASIELQRMKKFGLILVGCLAFVGLCGAHAEDINDVARAAVRRGANNPTVSTRQKSDLGALTASQRSSANRTQNVVSRNATNTRNSNTINRANDAPTASVVARTTSPAITRTRATTTARTTAPRNRTRVASTRNTARAATTVATREDILTRNYSKCKSVFNECMDEFCANKDTQLKRCACSSRINEFNRIKKQLADIDEKMLDFNQRLLTVSMDKEDAAALNIATEGEKAFYDTKDTSESKRALDAIAKKLNTSFDNSNFSSSLGGALSWSLDIDSAFDNIDSLGGASTAAKSGTALYSAALPVCREMAAEVCSETDLAIAESGYQVLITQDCNTVEKTYKSATDAARTKVLESSALLDMSRLNVHQTNNADDILTCKRKMLDMLTNSTVCGTNLGKCLDITGQYIDPSTGEAFLSSELSNLGDLITRPDENETWVGAPGNATFVSFLQSKKKFLEPAMEHCVDIADTVWNAFIEDALSQIKIAQLRKLEEVRQSCTTLTAQCLTNASDSITDFDARALSIFGVAADTTVNAMCDSVLSSCTTLLNTTDTDMEWYAGMTGIQTDITYDTIKKTCREVGRACVIQVCTSTSGNFGLCENIETSINRKSIVNRSACWNDVLECVASAGEDALKSIFAQNDIVGKQSTSGGTTYSYKYDALYGENYSTPTISNTSASSCVRSDAGKCVYDMCYSSCGGAVYSGTHECRVCRLAESIWGNCEAAPTTSLSKKGSHNRIIMPDEENTSATTILSWFATNTNTKDAADSCRDTTCGVGFKSEYNAETNTIMCVDADSYTDDDTFCGPPNKAYEVSAGFTNCCTSGATAATGNCCNSGKTNSDGFCVPTTYTPVAEFNIATATAYYPAGDYTMLCTGAVSNTSDNVVQCDGRYIIIKSDGSRYMDPDGVSAQYTTETFTDSDQQIITHKFINNAWGWYNGSSAYSGAEPQHWAVSFGQ